MTFGNRAVSDKGDSVHHREESSTLRLPLAQREPRIAVVVSQLGYGGAEKQTFELLRALSGTPWRPRMVVCLSDNVEPWGEVIRSLDYDLRLFARGSSFDLARLTALASLLRRERIDLVHAVHLLASGYVWLSARGVRVRVVPSVRGTVVNPGFLRSLVYRRMFASCQNTLVNSHAGALFLERRFGAVPTRVAVIPNGVDFQELRRLADPPRLRRLLHLGPQSRILGFVGKSSRVKNVPRFFEGYRRLRAKMPELHAVLVGSGLDEPARQSFAADLPAEYVHFLGTRQDLPSLLVDMDLLLLTSDSEGCPNVVLEALGLGTPVVSTDVGDVARMTRTGGGRVVDSDDIEGLARAAFELLDQGSIAKQRVRGQWDWLAREYALESMVRRTVELWKTTLEG